MPWWGWLLQVTGLVLLAVSTAFAVFNTAKRRPLAVLSYPITAATSLAAAVIYVLLLPKPALYAIVLSCSAGLAAGIGISLSARLEVHGKQAFSSHGQLHVAAWSFLLLVSSILAMAGTNTARVSASLALFSSLAVGGYAATVYARSRRGAKSPARASPGP